MGTVAPSRTWSAHRLASGDGALSISAIEHDLALARRQVAFLEQQKRAAERMERAQQSFPPDRLQSPAFIMVCRMMVGAIMAFPIVALVVIVLQRVFGGAA